MSFFSELSLFVLHEIPTLLRFVGMVMSHWTRSGGDGKQLRYSSDTVSPQTSQQD
ncbi:MAG: hypothetical protein MJZ52_07775 [Bacteroidales bacterium]|nr:hypothetical protein [Bacteroidales bacterium]